jgi:ribosome-associated protein
MLEKVKELAQFADLKKAENISVIDISKGSAIADYFVILTGLNQRHVQSLGDDIEREAHKLGMNVRGKEGMQKGEWVLIDLNDIVVHIFDKDNRSHYNLDKIWSHCSQISIDTIQYSI